MSCSKLIYCDECTLNNCWWAARSDESTTCAPNVEDIGSGFSYFVSPGDTEGCAAFKTAPIQTGTSSWIIGIIVFVVILVSICGIGILCARKRFSGAVQSWIANRRNVENVEMIQLNNSLDVQSTAL